MPNGSASRGSGRSSACSAPRRCGAAAARRAAGRAGARRSAARGPLRVHRRESRTRRLRPGRMRAPMAEIDFEAEGLLEGPGGRSARGATEAARTSSPTTASRSTSCGRRSRRTGWRCSRWSACSAAARSGLTAPRSPSGPGSTSDFLRRQWRALGLRGGDRGCGGLLRARRRGREAGPRASRGRPPRRRHPRGGAAARDDDVAARRGEPAAGRRRLHARGRHRGRGRDPLRRGGAELHAADRRPAPLRARRPPARADPPRRLRRSPSSPAGAPPSAHEVTVCFADMVGFTKLGETPRPGGARDRHREARRARGRGGRAAGAAGEADRRRGDARRARAGARGRRGARAGRGRRARRARTSRFCAPGSPRARPCRGPATGTGARSTWRAGSPRSRGPAACSPSEGVHDALADDYAWSFAGSRRLKGIDGSVKLYRCRRAE